jgi:hypothetical protein
MKPLQVFLEPELHKELKVKAASRGTTVSELIRDTVENLILAPSSDIILDKIDEIKPPPEGPTCPDDHISLNNDGYCIVKGCKYAR